MDLGLWMGLSPIAIPVASGRLLDHRWTYTVSWLCIGECRAVSVIVVSLIDHTNTVRRDSVAGLIMARRRTAFSMRDIDLVSKLGGCTKSQLLVRTRFGRFERYPR